MLDMSCFPLHQKCWKFLSIWFGIICLWCKQNGTADASTMYADEIYTAGFCYGLDVAVGESYNGVGEYA